MKNEESTPAEAQLAEMKTSFDLRWRADMRAIKAWQTKTGRTEVWPDHVDLVVWLLEQRDVQNTQMVTLLPRLGHDPSCRISRYRHPMALDLPPSECNCYLAELLLSTKS
jgi:hypothetical protein